MSRGQVRLVHGSGATGLQLVQSYSDSDEDSDGAWEGRLGDRYNPPGKVDCGSDLLPQVLQVISELTLTLSIHLSNEH